MSEQEKSGDTISATISGDVSGQVAIGKDITQKQTISTNQPVTEAEMAELRKAIADLKAIVAAEAPDEKKGAALERVDELADAVTAKAPDLSTMKYIKGWFVKNVPALANAVSGIVVHPIVEKLVKAAGDGLAADFSRYFGN